MESGVSRPHSRNPLQHKELREWQSIRVHHIPNSLVDSKSTAGDSVPVRVRSPAPKTAVPLRGAAVFYWLITDGNRRFDPRCPKNTSRRRRIFGWQSARRSAQRKAVRSPAPTSNPLSCKGFEGFFFSSSKCQAITPITLTMCGWAVPAKRFKDV